MLEIILAAVLFFVLFAVALLGDYGILQLLRYLGMQEDPILYSIRKTFEYCIVGVDSLLVGNYIAKGCVTTFKQTWPSKDVDLRSRKDKKDTGEVQ